MSMRAFEICDEVMGLSGFFPTSQYKASVDQDEKLIFFLLRRVARDIAKYRWQELVTTGRITILTGTDSYSLPDDFREFIPGSIKTDNDLRPLDFPSNFETWSRIDSKVGPTGIQHRLRIQQDKLNVLPDTGDGYTIRFDYVSNFPVLKGADGETRQDTFESDDDIWILDDDLIIKALKTKWSTEKRLDTIQADMGDFVGYQKELKGTQAGSQRICFGSRGVSYPRSPYTNLWK